MTPATWPRAEPDTARLLRIDPARHTLSDARVADLPRILRAGDLLVVNDAATLPASLGGRTSGGESVEVRLVGSDAGGDFTAVLFGAGDWRERTEDRPPPPPLREGERLSFGPDFGATLTSISPLSARLVRLRLDREGEALWNGLYRYGRPVQYSHIERPLALGHVQTAYASRPWSAELPSAGYPLTLGLLLRLRRAGVELATLTHAAGLSSTGDPTLDAHLPLPEPFEIPPETVEAVEGAKVRGCRVVAVGTTVVRALEGAAAAARGRLHPGPGVTDLRIGAAHRPVVVDGLLTGIHEPGTSHFTLLTAFAPAELLEQAYRHAEAAGYVGHEFGDSSLIQSN
ncbi:MAG TPA: S-adenosylmethionine:tRNA ribosyltransferase-isomerase [Vicinamibacteria bacterium]|jgi:S-adenosylmethionine:tRNA ribosyltransferase-isomerase|nr:S-adenosylmethionine:tRNA ribosyltransferase-isomerase [Vicinamibacteria bacterium]